MATSLLLETVAYFIYSYVYETKPADIFVHYSYICNGQNKTAVKVKELYMFYRIRLPTETTHCSL